MVGSASGPGSTFKAFLGSSRISGPVKTSSLQPLAAPAGEAD